MIITIIITHHQGNEECHAWPPADEATVSAIRTLL